MATTAEPPPLSPLLEPTGLRRPEPGLEFYRVAPGGATAIDLHGDDRVRVIDRHGGQRAELTARGPEGLHAL